MRLRNVIPRMGSVELANRFVPLSPGFLEILSDLVSFAPPTEEGKLEYGVCE